MKEREGKGQAGLPQARQGGLGAGRAAGRAANRAGGAAALAQSCSGEWG